MYISLYTRNRQREEEEEKTQRCTCERKSLECHVTNVATACSSVVLIEKNGQTDGRMVER